MLYDIIGEKVYFASSFEISATVQLGIRQVALSSRQFETDEMDNKTSADETAHVTSALHISSNAWT